MNGMIVPSVSAGSSHRAARETCTPHVITPSGAASSGPAHASRKNAIATSAVATRLARPHIPSLAATHLLEIRTRPGTLFLQRLDPADLLFVAGQGSPVARVEKIQDRQRGLRVAPL